MSTTIPFPPLDLAHRVGAVAEEDEPFLRYDQIGRSTKESLVSLLPRGWTFEQKRVLDFGCGAGRTLRHFVAEAETCEFHACDVDEHSIAWLGEHLVPPFRGFLNGESPPLDLTSGSFDLVYAVSVFTHLTDRWSAWLLELRRILADDGLLIATFIGEGAAPWITDEPWREDAIGMNVLSPGQSWKVGGPMVLHSPWWIRARWGRAFEILNLQPHGFADDPPAGQGVVVMKKRRASLSMEDLERLEPDEPRELSALAHNVEQLQGELVQLHAAYDQLTAAWTSERVRREGAESQAAQLQDSLEGVARSRSWRLTAPLRMLAARLLRKPAD